jgi:hypothetical protein
MFESIFANPAALTVGGAMVSSPILIHLINRMRFKRLRWAAMEFLLKSQKRNRRRLIIEQLLLLLLRCLLIALAALLFARFIGLSFGGFEQAGNLHVVLLDDSLSMKDKIKGQPDCFDLAKKGIENLAVNVGQSTTNDGLVIFPLSELEQNDQYRPKDRRRLGDTSVSDELKRDLAALKCTALSGSLLKGLRRAKDIADSSTDRVTVHIYSDYRKLNWTGDSGKELSKLMLELGRHKNVKFVYMVDCADPRRDTSKGVLPPHHDNLAITEVRPSTRIASVGSRVFFTVTVANFGTADASVEVRPYDNESGQELSLKDYETDSPFKVQAGKSAQCVFSLPISKDLGKDEQRTFHRIAVRLLKAGGVELENDGLADDDVRHAVIEVRRTIPVLIIDGSNADGRRPEGDSYYVYTALKNVQDSKYEVHFGDEIMAAADSRQALESPELSKYTSILMINVPELQNELQLANLERFVREGGGVAFFMGPDIKPAYYNTELYKKGTGVFPVPIADVYEPVGAKLPPPNFTGRFQVLLRDDQFLKTEKIPIFGPVLNKPRLREFLKHLPVQRHWPALSQDQWQGKPGEVREIANLPNEEPASKYTNDVQILTKKLLQVNDKDFGKGLARHADTLNKAVGPNAKYPAHVLADFLTNLLEDPGKDLDRVNYPNMVEFWDLRDPAIQDLKQEVQALRKRLLYSSPLVLTKNYGQGRVVAWMTTAGKEWNPWPSGLTGTAVYAPLMYELQNYLTSQSGDSGRLVGDPVTVTVDGKRFQQGKTLALSQRYYQPDNEKPEKPGKTKEFQGKQERGNWTFRIEGCVEPGYYESTLVYGDGAPAIPATAWGHAFNVDTKSESNLQRVSQEDLDSSFMRQVHEKVGWRNPIEPSEVGKNRAWDLSEWPFFFLFFILVLVAEQALAVHLSFHLKTNEAELPSQVVRPQARAA